MSDPASGDLSGSERAELNSAIEGLREAIQRGLDRNDLGRLAQMHSACQALSAVGGAAGELTGAAANLLEGVILNEVTDADRSLELVVQAVGVLGNTLAGQDAEVGTLLTQLRAAAGENTPGASSTLYVSAPLTIDSAEREHLEGFIEESGEHVEAIEAALLDVEKSPTDTSKINELFRPFHTIKGIAGFLNLRDINRLTHEVETILDKGRKGELKISASTIDLVFAAVDVLKQQIGRLASYLANPTGEPVPQPDIADIVGRLRAAATGTVTASVDASLRLRARDLTSAGPASDELPLAEQPATARASPNEDSVADGDKAAGSIKSGAETSIRVDTGKLDFLVDAVGELVIAQTMVNQNGVVWSDERLGRAVSHVTKIVRDVQETAMAMRMIPIGQTFQKMRRLVRDVARKAGKQVELEIAGEETELDKNMIQAISDPLVHMVRNAVDHGIETPEVRRAAGKPEVGRVFLNAFHRGDSVVIEIRDDGRGLDREKLIAKGIERGLVAPDAQLSDQKVFGLIMQPGFTTADQVSEISGRGVGMDVVRRNVERLRGKIEIASEPGWGSIFSVRLPLTLAIIDGMLVRVGKERLIIPTILIEQSLRPEPWQITVVQRKGAMIRVRDELITLVQLGPLFGFSEPVDPTEGLVVITQTEGQKIGIVVDRLIGQQQVVIKTLGERFKHVKGVSGAAILGDGQVGLILDPTGVLALHNRTEVAIAATGGDEAIVPAGAVLQGGTPTWRT